jgi:DNA-binding transcriptional regulator YiaG
LTRTTWTQVSEDRRMAMNEAERAEYDRAYAEARLAADVGERIRAARETAGLSQRDLATRMGTSQAAVARLEAGGVGGCHPDDPASRRRGPRAGAQHRPSTLGIGMLITDIFATFYHFFYRMHPHWSAEGNTRQHEGRRFQLNCRTDQDERAPTDTGQHPIHVSFNPAGRVRDPGGPPRRSLLYSVIVYS